MTTPQYPLVDGVLMKAGELNGGQPISITGIDGAFFWRPVREFTATDYPPYKHYLTQNAWVNKHVAAGDIYLTRYVGLRELHDHFGVIVNCKVTRMGSGQHRTVFAVQLQTVLLNGIPFTVMPDDVFQGLSVKTGLEEHLFLLPDPEPVWSLETPQGPVPAQVNDWIVFDSIVNLQVVRAEVFDKLRDDFNESPVPTEVFSPGFTQPFSYYCQQLADGVLDRLHYVNSDDHHVEVDVTHGRVQQVQQDAGNLALTAVIVHPAKGAMPLAFLIPTSNAEALQLRSGNEVTVVKTEYGAKAYKRQQGLRTHLFEGKVND